MTVTFRWLGGLDSTEPETWRAFLRDRPHGHPFQDPAWGDIMRSVAYEPRFIVGEENGRRVLVALVLTHRLRLIGGERWLIPRGPVCGDLETLDAALTFVEREAQARGVLLCVANPYWREPAGVESLMQRRGWTPDQGGGMHASSLEIDLRPSVADLHRSFRQTTRHEIEKAERAGLVAQRATDVAQLRSWFELYRAQMTRKELGHSPWEFFRALWDRWLADQSGGTLILAQRAGELGAGAVILKYNQHAWYTFAARNPAIDLPAGHLALWCAIQWAREAGCEIFDLGGWAGNLPRTDPTYGVAMFKAGFSKRSVEFPREHTRIFSPRRYQLFEALGRLRSQYRKYGERLLRRHD